jgi:hypothetical protein
MLTAAQCRISFHIPENTASHKNVSGVFAVIFDLLEAFVDPVDAISAINHPACSGCAGVFSIKFL